MTASRTCTLSHWPINWLHQANPQRPLISISDLNIRADFAYIALMRQILTIAFVLVLGGLPLQAQETNDDVREGFSLLQEGTRLLLEGLLKEIGPALLELQGRIIDLNAYYAPEVLPNGDIIIRRKVPLIPAAPSEGETDL